MRERERHIDVIVHERVAAIFDLEQVTDDTSFVDLGTRSEGVLRLQSDLRESIGQNVDLSDLFSATTVGDIVEAARRGRNP